MILKDKPEDFIVKEISNVTIKETGPYTYYTLKKTDYPMHKAITYIANKFKVKDKLVGYAGTKDKRAITYQTISIKKGIKKSFNFKDLELTYVGKGDNPISLGALLGNVFEIRVSGVKKPNEIEVIPNYFDEQRFSKDNVEVGMNIIKNNFKAICPDAKNNDYLREFKKTPFRFQKIYLASVQSFIFNEIVYRYLKKFDHNTVKYSLGKFAFVNEEIKNLKIPLVGFDTEFKDDEVSKIAQDVLSELKIVPRDFIIRSHPDLTVEGGERDIIVRVENLEIRDEKNSYVVKFFLQKGSYATIVMKNLFL